MRLFLLAIALLAVPAQAEPQTTRPVVRTAADLPQTRYPISDAPSRYVFTDAFLTELLPRLRADTERVLANSDFAEVQLKRQVVSGLAAIALLENRPADAERLILAQRAIETQPLFRALAILHFEALAATLASASAERCLAGARRLAERLASTDPTETREEVVGRWGQLALTSRAYDGASLQFADRSAAGGRGVDLLDGLTMARVRATTDLVPPCRAELTAALRTWLDDSPNAEVDIWPGRESPASIFVSAAPVTVAVWDTGLDYTLFAGRLAIDPAEPLDGRDNDGNGVVDDVHGPTFDGRLRPSREPMQPLSGPLAQRYLIAAALAQGESDHRLGLDTPSARQFGLHARSSSVEEQAIDLRLRGELNYREHGTFVASQIVENLPFVRLYNVRMLPFSLAPEPVFAAEPEMERLNAQLRPTIRRMRAARVRVVYMGLNRIDDGGRRLLAGGFETDPERARQRSRAMHEAFRDALAAALSEAPDILFVVPSAIDGGRNDSAPIPSSLPLPNVVVVGAVRSDGAPAIFTSLGDRVRLYSNGGRVRARSSGGGWAFSNGPSVAAPLVVRTAAQMLAVNPRLTPTQLIEGMIATATANSQGLRLVHPAAAVEWARSQQGGRP